MQMKKVRASVAGASGYAGGELVRWLTHHPSVDVAHVTAFREQGRPLADVFPNLRGFGDHTLNGAGWPEMARDSDVVFLALPHGAAIEAVPVLLLEAVARVVDLGCRLPAQDADVYALVGWITAPPDPGEGRLRADRG